MASVMTIEVWIKFNVNRHPDEVATLFSFGTASSYISLGPAHAYFIFFIIILYFLLVIYL